MSSLLINAKKRLHEQGGRMTHQRRVILEALEELDCHPTAEELFEKASQVDSNLNLSTVYRTLRWMETEGLIIARRFNIDHRQDRFDSATPSEHHHFLCSKCKKVIEFNDPSINDIKTRFEESTGCVVESKSIILYGLCEICRNENDYT